MTDLLPMVPERQEVTALLHPFRMERTPFFVPHGLTIREIVRNEIGVTGHAIVLMGDLPLAEPEWDIVPYLGAHLTIKAIPMGGGGGGGKGKNPLRTILTLAVTVVSFVAAPYLAGPLAASMGITSELGVSLLTAGIRAGLTAIGMMAVNAIAPPAMPGTLSMRATSPYSLSSAGATGSRSDIERSPSLSGGRNTSNRYGPVPQVLGTHKIIPPYAADPYTEIRGSDQYLRMLFTCGYGPLSISDLKIGETDIDEYSGVSYEIKYGYDTDTDVTLYTNDVDEETLNVHLTSAGSWHTRTTEAETNEISFDIVFPNGLIEFVEDRAANQTSYVDQETGEVTTEGALLPPETERSVVVEWGYSVSGANSWTTGRITTTAKTGKTIRKSHRIAVTEGQYDVRLKRVTADSGDSRVVDNVYWSALRSIHTQDPISMDGVAKIAIMIKATDQLNGVVDTFSCVASALIKDYDSGTGTWLDEQATSNPASLYRHVLQGAANKRALSDSEIDLDGLAEWHTFCDTNGFEYNQVIDFQTSVQEILREIASAGRASPAMVDGKYGVVWDREQTTPIQHFSPRNSWGFSSKKYFPDLPHAFRVRFPSADKGYREDERIVYDDGYTSANATRFEQLELPGITDSDLAWKHGRYHIACARLRPEEYSFFCDVENLVCTRGDLVRVTHDVPLWGLGWARVKTVTDDGTYATGVTLDGAMTMAAGTSYSMRFRLSDGSTLLMALDTVEGSSASVAFATPVLIASGPEVGDMAFFGVTGSESTELIIKNIEPGPDLTARLTCVDYSSAVYSADTGTIPDFDSNITLPVDVVNQIGTPTIESIQSDEGVLVRGTDGSLRPRIVVAFKYKTGHYFDQIAETQLEFRLNGSDEDWVRITALNYVESLSVQDVGEGQVYDLRCRYKTFDGRVSLWTSIRTHTVVGKSTPPPDVPRLFVDTEYFYWSYPSPPADFAGFRIRHRSGSKRLWADATPAHSDLIKGSRFPITSVPTGSGIRTVMIKAEDVAGNQSSDVAAVVLNLGDPSVDNVVVTEDLAADGYPGTITNGTVDGTDLEADGVGTDFWYSGLNQFWAGDDDDLFWVGGYKRMNYITGRERERLFWTGTAGTVFWTDDEAVFWASEYVTLPGFIPDQDYLPSELSVEYAITGDPYWVTYRTAGALPFWTAIDSTKPWAGEDTDLFWSGPDAWEVWPGKVDAKRQRYEFQVTTAAGATRGVISEFTVQLDVPDITETLEDVSIGGSGTRLTLTETYRSIVAVQITLQDDGGDAVRAALVDKSTSGPLIKCYDSAGALTAGTIDARVQGY